MRLVISILATFLALPLFAAEKKATPQDPWTAGQANSNLQAAQLMQMAQDEDDASMKYMMMMMAMQQQMQSAAYKSSQEKSQGDKKKETDGKNQSQLSVPSPSPAPSQSAPPAAPEETLVFQENIKAINEKISTASKQEVVSSYPLPSASPLTVDLNLARDVASIPEEVPKVREVGKVQLAAISESARNQSLVLASVSSPLDAAGRPMGVSTVDARGANSTSAKDLGSLSTAIEQAVNPSPAKKGGAVYDEAEGGESKPEKSGGGGFNSMFEMLMGQMNPSEGGMEEQMGVEFGEYKTGKRRVPNIFQVAQFLYQVTSEESRVKKNSPKK